MIIPTTNFVHQIRSWVHNFTPPNFNSLYQTLVSFNLDIDDGTSMISYYKEFEFNWVDKIFMVKFIIQSRHALGLIFSLIMMGVEHFDQSTFRVVIDVFIS